MSIVCLTNFSEQARKAGVAAAHLARAANLPLHLVHVVPQPLSEAAGASLKETLGGIVRDEADKLSALGARVEVSVIEGPLAEAVVEYCRSRGAQLLVAGANRTESPFGGMGGHLDRLAVTSEVPLVVVKDPRPFEQWALGKRPLKVMVGVDRSVPFGAAREWIARLRKIGAVELTAARVFYPAEECQRFGLPAPYVFDEVPPLLEEALLRETADLVGPQPDGKPVRVLLQQSLGRQADPLVALAQQEAADLVVVGTHHRKGVARLWSVSHHTLRLAPMSVAAVPAAAAAAEGVSPPSLQRVLVTTDLSPLGNAAVAWAFAIAAPQATVHLLHVVGPNVEAGAQQELRRQLERLIPPEAVRKERVAVTEVLASKSPAAAIQQTAERLNADAICIASHGRSAVMTALMGSVATEVLKGTRRPVLIVRPTER